MGLETLKAWTRSKDLARAAYRSTMGTRLERHYGLSDQIRRAAVSVPANLAEGYALGTRPQLLKYLRISLASARELMLHVEFAKDMGLIDQPIFDDIAAIGNEAINLMVGLLRKLS
jgi:four helix bundle protein